MCAAGPAGVTGMMEAGMADRGRASADRGYGAFLALGLAVGFGVGVAIGEPSAGTVIGLGAGGLVALFLRLRG